MKDIPGRSVVYCLISISVLLVFYLLAVMPLQRSNFHMEQDIGEMRALIEKYQVMVPMYGNLVRKAEKQAAFQLPLPEEKKITKDQIDIVAQDFAVTAEKFGIQTISVVPDLGTLTAGSASILMEARFRGGLEAFHAFLVELGKFSYLQKLEEIYIQQELPEKLFGLRVWLAVEK